MTELQTQTPPPTRAEALSVDDLTQAWLALSLVERVEGFQLLTRADAEEFFLDHLDAREQEQLLLALPPNERRLWMRLLAPDDAADLIQEADKKEQEGLLLLLDEATRKEVQALLAYAEDEAGGLMSPRFARLRASMSVDEAIKYLRIQARGQLETLYYVYVLDNEQRLLGVVSFRELFAAAPTQTVQDIMETDVATVADDMDQEAVSRLFKDNGLIAMPVVDAERRMQGIITVDDIVDVVEEEATEDIQKLGGSEALSGPYLESSFGEMVRKRAGWLTILFFSEMLTATAMSGYANEIEKAVVLALFLPLIISSGGNSGSQATTLIIRALALGDVKLTDWWRVLRREVLGGAALGVILGTIGFMRVISWHMLFGSYGEHYALIALTIALSLVGVVMWGTIAGSMLPFVLRRLGLDPASASAPFVATLIDVTGLIIYFTTASIVLRGSLL
jgi:magnesium transporter